MDHAAIKFYGLMYIDRRRNLDANIKHSFADPVDIHIACSSLLAASAAAHGVFFGLFTNAPEFVSKRYEAFGARPSLITGCDFSRSIPKVKNYHSAHFKLDVIKALSSGAYGPAAGLIDLDSVFLKSPTADAVMTDQAELATLDLSAEIFDQFGADRVRRDLELVAGCGLQQPRWFGGEFLVGNTASLGLLSDEIETCWPRYTGNLQHLHHAGDEMPVSAALNRLIAKGFRVNDAGRTGVAARWWSQRTKRPQPVFDDMTRYAILHLPADKPFLARQAKQPFSPETFLADFRAYLERKLLRKRLLTPLSSWPLPQVVRK